MGHYNRHKITHGGPERLGYLYPGCEQSFARSDARSKHLLNRRLHPVALPVLEVSDESRLFGVRLM